MKIWVYCIIALMLLAVVVVVLVIPMRVHSTPAWEEESTQLLGRVGSALEQYSNDHHGAFPSSLAELYPNYIANSADLQPVVKIRDKYMTFNYYRPSRLGNPKTVVLKISLKSPTRSNYQFRTFELRGNMRLKCIR